MGSVTADIYASNPIPPTAATLLQQAQPSASSFSTDQSISWVLVQSQLCLWRYSDGVDARVVSIRLPSQAQAAQRTFVSVLTAGTGPQTTATVLVCTDTGLVLAYPNVAYSTEPLLHQVPGISATRVCAFTAVAPAVSSGMLFVAALSAQDGSCYLIQGNQQGMHSKQLTAGAPAAPQQRSVLSVLGSAIASAYTEAFDPNAKFVKRWAAEKPALCIAAQLIDIHHLHIYVLTDATLDCWQMTVGLRLSEQLLWSAQTILAAGSAAHVPSAASNTSFVVCGDTAYVLMSHHGHGHDAQHWILRLVIKPDTSPVYVDCCLVPIHSSQQAHWFTAVHAAPSKNAVLLMDSTRHLYEWVMGEHSPGCSLLSDDPDTLAAVALEPASQGGVQGGGPCWQVLNATYGVLQLRVGSAGAGHSTASTALLNMAGGTIGQDLTAEQKVHVHQLLDTTLAQAASVQAAGQPLMSLAMGLRCRLAGLGALNSTAAAGILAEYSTSLIDTLPKQWATSSGGGAALPGSSHAVTIGLLTAKDSKHHLLLRCLHEAGILHALPRSIIKVLVENGEKLSAAGAISQLHAHITSQQQQQGQDARPVSIIQQVIHAAGSMVASAGDAQGSAQEALPPVELFYSRPSASLPALLSAMKDAAAVVREQATSGLGRPGDASSSQLSQYCAELAQLLGQVVGAVSAKQTAVAANFHIKLGQLYKELRSPSWMADANARQAMETLTLAVQAVRQLLLSVSSAAAAEAMPPAVSGLASIMLGCTEQLLSGFAAAVAAAQGPEQQAQLLAEYTTVRERCVGSLVRDAVAQLNRRMPLPADCLLLQVLALSAAHHCYPVLFTACEAVDNWEGHASNPATLAFSSGTSRASLHYYMTSLTAEEGMPASHTFAKYCFQRLLDEGRAADLLQLPSTFHNDLRIFLQQQPKHASLLWPLLLRMEEWSGALEAVVLDAQAHKVAYQQQHRLYCIAKLCALQAADVQAASHIGQRLQLLDVQHALLQLPGALEVCYPQGTGQLAALEPTQLVAAAVQLEQQVALHGQAAILALQALAASPPDVQQANRSALQAAWQHLLAATDWGQLAAQYQQVESSGQNAYHDALQDTPVFKAAAVCRRSGLFGQGSSVVDTGPAQEMLALVKQLAQADKAMLQHGVQAFQCALQLEA